MISLTKLKRRACVIQALRRFFVDHGFLEVDTPIRLSALAPEAYIEPIRSGTSFLQTSPELGMKRLLAAGASDIFQICRCFRASERGVRHLPEFTMLEWYRAGGDCHDLMSDCQELIRSAAASLGLEKIVYKGISIDLGCDWERITVAEAFGRLGGIEVEKAIAEDRFEEILVTKIEPQLAMDRPVFLVDFPTELAALAKISETNDQVAERFELYIGGLELANGFSELTDPVEQRRRFELERVRIVEAGRDPGPMPESFLAALDGMGPAAGIALGVDRLLMVLANSTTIDEVITFLPEEI